MKNRATFTYSAHNGQEKTLTYIAPPIASTYPGYVGVDVSSYVATMYESWSTRLNVEPGSTYKDSEGFTRFKFYRSSNSPRFSVSSFNATNIVTLMARTLLETSTTFWPPPTCAMREEFCEYVWDSYISKRIAATSLTSLFRDDPEWPVACTSRGKCSLIIGEELVLIHWGASSRSNYAGSHHPTRFIPNQSPHISPRTFVTTAITFQGQDLWPAKSWRWREESGPITTTSVLYGNFTFTSPTVYIAHHPMTLSALMPRRSRSYNLIRNAGIFPISATDIYTNSLMISNPAEWAKSVARGELSLPFNDPPSTLRRIDFADMQEPVRASVYYSHNRVCWSAGNACATITEGSFRPRLYLHDRVWFSILTDRHIPQWCSLPLLWDPEISITPIPGRSEPEQVSFPQKRTVDVVASIFATTTAVFSSSDRMISNEIAMTIATQTAYHISETYKYPAKETRNAT